jgi:NADPH:quinone reductase-like Zn-dependent oxidoreductase
VLLLAVAGLGETIAARGNVKAGPASERPEHLARVLQLAADGALAPLIEASYPLDAVAQAYARIDSGRKVGNIVLHPQDAAQAADSAQAAAPASPTDPQHPGA